MGQPLLPRWSLEVAHGPDALPDADVAVVAPVLVEQALAAGRVAGMVTVLDRPDDVVVWNGVGSLVLADEPWSQVARAVEETARGGVWISDRVAPHLAFEMVHQRRAATGPSPQEPLTATESQTLALILAGRSNAWIAASRGVSVSTVKSCVRAVLKKYGCASRQQLIALFVNTGR